MFDGKFVRKARMCTFIFSMQLTKKVSSTYTLISGKFNVSKL